MRIYADNNATTPMHPNVLATLQEMLRDVFGNASSIHKEGQTARRVIEEARESVAGLLGATPREIVFTSGGTESNNAALYGAIPAEGRHHIVTTGIEHPSILEVVRDLVARGCQVTIVPPNRDGVVPAKAVIDAIRNNTTVVAMMLANNETGVVQPVASVGNTCADRGIHFHVDAVQAAGKIDIDVNALYADTLAISAHKMHAPKGIGALYVRGRTKLHPHLVGGAQERRRRAGTENVPLAAAFGVAAQLAADPEPRRAVAALRDAFERSLTDVTINGAGVPRVPNTSSVTFRNGDAEAIVIALDLHGIAASTGSACSSGRVEPSRVLLAMGLTRPEAKATVRFSFSRFTTAEEVARVGEVLQEVLPGCLRL